MDFTKTVTNDISSSSQFYCVNFEIISKLNKNKFEYLDNEAIEATVGALNELKDNS